MLPNVNGVALELEASKTAEIDSRAIERATWSAQPRVKLFCCFFIDVFLWFFGCWAMFVICHLFPKIPDEVPEKFSKRLTIAVPPNNVARPRRPETFPRQRSAPFPLSKSPAQGLIHIMAELGAPIAYPKPGSSVTTTLYD